MEIVAGKAKGISLRSPESNDVRPTAVRARRALFDSLGDLSGLVFADLCAGSGAMGLEAASRGAAKVYFIEKNASVLRLIRQNCTRIQRAGVETEFEFIQCEIPSFPARLLHGDLPDIIFADPPYDLSTKLLKSITGNPVFLDWAGKCTLYWELPDAGAQLEPPCDPWKIVQIRTLGPARFLILKCNL